MQYKDALPYLLSRCTARLVVNSGAEYGTGCFVAPGYLITCAHVVNEAYQDHGRIDALWDGQKYAATIEKITSQAYPDLALLKIDGISDHPCAYLYGAISLGNNLYTYGYPADFSQGEPATFAYEGQHEGEYDLLKLKLGNVKPGFSGSPLLNLHTGAVCGVVKRTIGEDSLLGGRAVPISHVLEAFPEIKALQEQFHSQDSRWADCLTLQQRQVNGLNKLLSSSQHGAVEIFFSYHEKDRKWLDALELQLALLQRNGAIDAWHTGKLAANTETETETLKHLDSARIICLLVSPNYIANTKLYTEHVDRAMKRREIDGTIIIPILTRPTTGWKDTSFGGLLTIPRNGVPMSKWSDRDEVSMVVADEIKRAAEALHKPKG